MPLRTANNLNIPSILWPAFINIALGYPTRNTQAGVQSYPTYFQSEAEMLAGAFPALHGKAKNHRSAPWGATTYADELTMVLDYYDDPAKQVGVAFDTIWQNLRADQERIMSNIQTNQSLKQNNTAYTIAGHTHSLSDYDRMWREFSGRRLVVCTYQVTFHLLPYDALT
jgi:hypothetical protein